MAKYPIDPFTGKTHSFLSNVSLSKVSYFIPKSVLVEAELTKYQYGKEISTVGVDTPYNGKFVNALKKAVPATDRMWDPIKKEWVVSIEYLDKVKDLVKTYFAVEPMISVQKSKVKDPLAAKKSLTIYVISGKLEVETPYDKEFLVDFKSFFEDRKWNGSSKRWVVPYTKENMNMAIYLIKRHYKKSPTINK